VFNLWTLSVGEHIDHRDVGSLMKTKLKGMCNGRFYYPGMCDGHQDKHGNFSDNGQRAEPYQEQSEAQHFNQIKMECVIYRPCQ